MSPEQQWEYAIIQSDSDEANSWTSYSAPQDTDHDEYPHGAFSSVIGELGGKGWEMISVTEAFSSEGILRQRLYFKRPHRPDRELKA